ncbi:MAG: hypothetical protein KDJ50_04120 [Alphaproteobacteria bacterium]|nr:hypothetical protein [Alphaproteobacteria bacterium]
MTSDLTIFSLRISLRFYVVTVMCLIGLLCSGFVGLNYALNDFGLWRDHAMPNQLYGDPLTAKYLLSQRAIPLHFDSLLIGPSVSANVDVGNIASLEMYNLSVQGTNILRIRPTLEAFLENNKRPGTLVFCLYPYFTNNLKLVPSRAYDDPERSALFSTIPLHAYLSRAGRYFSGEAAYDKSSRGMIDISEVRKDHRPPYAEFAKKQDKKIAALIAQPAFTPHDKIIDPEAYKALAEVIESARLKGYRIVAYYYPLNYRDFTIRQLNGEWPYFQQEMNKLFLDRDVVLDFNTSAYDDIRKSETAYMDNHLNRLGADRFAEVLDDALARLNQR